MNKPLYREMRRPGKGERSLQQTWMRAMMDLFVKTATNDTVEELDCLAISRLMSPDSRHSNRIPWLLRLTNACYFIIPQNTLTKYADEHFGLKFHVGNKSRNINIAFSIDNLPMKMCFQRPITGRPNHFL